MTRTLRRIAAVLSQADRYDVLITIGIGGWFCMMLLTGALVASAL